MLSNKGVAGRCEFLYARGAGRPDLMFTNDLHPASGHEEARRHPNVVGFFEFGSDSSSFPLVCPCWLSGRYRITPRARCGACGCISVC
jgi:hypothetical protein